MKLNAFGYEVPWRQNWQIRASITWGVGAAVCIPMTMASMVPAPVWLSTSAFCAGMAGYRFWRGRGLQEMQVGLKGRELTFTTFDELQRLAHGHEGRQWLGKGFVWGTKHAQRVYEIQKRTEEVVDLAKMDSEDLEPAQVGQRWIHGVETEERDIWQPLKHTEAHTLIVGTPGSGKAQPLDALVHTPKGFVTMGSLKVGDQVTTCDGRTAPILGIYPQGTQAIYRIRLRDGRSTQATLDHLWEVHVLEGAFKGGKRFYKLFELLDFSPANIYADSVEFAEKLVDTSGRIPVVLTTKILKGLLALGLQILVPTARNIQLEKPLVFPDPETVVKYILSDVRTGVAPVQFTNMSPVRIVRTIEEKASWDYRRDFIKTLKRHCNAQGDDDAIILWNAALAGCLQKLAWSVDAEAVLKTVQTDGQESQSLTIRFADTDYRGWIESMDLIERREDTPPAHAVPIQAIEYVDDREAQCIMVDHPRELYVTDDYIVTHNTRMLDLLVSQAILRGETVLIIDPKGDAELKNNAERACKLLGRANDFVQFHLAFPEESIRIDPLRNFSNNFEIAERIRTLLASGGSNDTFSNFSWLAINNLVEGMMLCYEKPTLLRLRMLLEGGIERLVTNAIQNYGRRVDKEFEAHKEEFDFMGKDARGIASEWEKYYRKHVEPTWPHAGLNGLISQFNHDAEHFSKMVASLQPIMQMLTSGSLADILSPSDDNSDMRPLLDMKRIVNQNLVAYFGLDAMKAGQTASAIGSLILADLTSVAGSRYDYSERLGQVNSPVNIFVDEASEVVNDPFIQMLNKARGAGFRIWVATQTFADFQSKLQDKAKATQVLANVNNIIAFRTLDPETQKYFCEPIPKTRLKYVMRTQGQNTDSKEPIVHGANFGERLMEEEADLISPQLLGLLPGLEYIARISGGHIVKGRIPILVAKEGDKN